MKTLAIESATPASSVAVGDGGQLLAMALNVDKRGHVGFLTDAVDFCMRKAGLRPVDLDMIIVDVGPGAFTGIRAGIATAQGVGAAVGVPWRCVRVRCRTWHRIGSLRAIVRRTSRRRF